MPFAVRESLHHFRALSPPSLSAYEDDQNEKGFEELEKNAYIRFRDPKP